LGKLPCKKLLSPGPEPEDIVPGHQNNSYGSIFARTIGPGLSAFPFWKGRVALYAILKALGISAGDEVILPAYTCVVVPNAVRRAGAKPVYADILPDSYHIDPAQVQALLGPKTRAVLLQHTYGIPACLQEIMTLAGRQGIPVIEDCAHVLGTTLNGKHLGLLGDAAFFSSQWSKPYTTGLGGIAVTRRPDLAARLGEIQQGFRPPSRSAQLRLAAQYRLYRRFFNPRLYWTAQSILHLLSRCGLFVGSSNDSELAGELPSDHEWRMSDFQKQVGTGQLPKAVQDLGRRRRLAGHYDEVLRMQGWSIPARTPETVLLRYPLQVKDKPALLEQARRARVELGCWFETPLHPAPLEAHAVFGYRLGDCPNAELAAAQAVNLPMHDRIDLQEAQRILQFFLSHASPALP
jgi:perosamine synthetase